MTRRSLRRNNNNKTGKPESVQKINQVHISASLEKVNSMTLQQQETAYEEIYALQPDLLSSILVQTQFGSTHQEVGIMLNIFLVIMMSLKIAGVSIPAVQSGEIEKMLMKVVKQIRFTENLNGEQLSVSIDQFLDAYKEKTIIAYALNAIVEADFHNKSGQESKLYLAGLSAAACIAKSLEIR